MDNKKNTKIDAACRRKTGGSRCFKKRSFKGNRHTKSNNLTNISSNTTAHQASQQRNLEKAEQSSYLLNGMDVFSQVIY